MPRFFCPTALLTGTELDLPAGAARHVQVLRLQPGDAITLFNHGPGWGGPFPGGEFDATVVHMGRSDVRVRVGDHHPVEREPAHAVHLALGMPANERMDWLVEKATELGVRSIQPLMTERSVLRLSGERAEKKVAHWQSVAVAACEQCGGNRVPDIYPIATFKTWLQQLPAAQDTTRAILSLGPLAVPLQRILPIHTLNTCFVSGPEGGLSPSEEEAAVAAGFTPTSLGPRVLRAETAALAALTHLL